MNAPYFFYRLACGANDFKCGNGYCIPASKHCDRTNDCQDGSDERHCSYGLNFSKFTNDHSICKFCYYRESIKGDGVHHHGNHAGAAPCNRVIALHGHGAATCVPW